MAEFLLIRHAQSANNAQDETKRVCDPELTPLGVLQAHRLASHLHRCGRVRKLYCSPFLRSLETARAVAERLGLVPFVHAELFEEGGCYSGHPGIGRRGEPGMGAEEIRRRYPAWRLDARIKESGWWGREFEVPAEAVARAIRVKCWMEQQLAPEDGVHALIIHADFKQRLLEAMLGTDAVVEAGVSRNTLGNVGVSRLRFHSGSWLPQSLNDTSHLPPRLRTP